MLTTGVAQCEKMFLSIIAGLALRDISCGRNRLPGPWEIHIQSQKVLGSSLLGPKASQLCEQVLLISTEVSETRGSRRKARQGGPGSWAPELQPAD